MNKMLRSYTRQLIWMLTIFMSIMIVLGVYFYTNLEGLVNNLARDRVKREAEAAADYYARDLLTAMTTIQHLGVLLEDSREMNQKENIAATILAIESMFKNQPSILFGIMNGESRAVYGERIDPAPYPGFLYSLGGIDGISYMETGAVLFTHPVLHGDNVRYIMYAECSLSYIKEHHGLGIISNLGNVSLMTSDGKEVLPFTRIENGRQHFYTSKSVSGVFERLRREHNLEPSAAERVKTIYGDMYFYIAQIEDTDFLLAGMISYEEAAGRAGIVPNVVMYIYTALMLMTTILGALLITSAIKARQSDVLRKEKQVAEESSKAKGMFLANMSHEIRTPINAIMGMGELITREAEDPKIQHYAYNINSSANTLLCLVNDVLDFSRMEAGKLTLREDPYYLSSILTDVESMIRNRADSKGLIYKVKLNREMPDKLIGDGTRLKQVIINLLTNGVKYTLAGFVNLTMDYEKVSSDEIILKVSVKDTGIGMKQEDIDRLFNVFERLDEDRNKTVEGTGLGMSIVKQILDAMDTTLKVESVYGAGSNFSFEIKQKVGDWERIGDYEVAAQKEEKKKENYKVSFVASSATVLVVDDTEINLRVIEGLLSKTQIQVHTALGGKIALELMKKVKYDVALIDHRMPEMDGIELLKHVRFDDDSINRDTPCIALTANVVPGVRDMYISAGFDDYMEKPVSGKLIEDMLRRYISEDKVQQMDSDEAEDTQQDTGAVEKPAIPPEIMDEILRLQNEGYIDYENGVELSGSEELFLDTLEFFRDSIDDKADEIEELYFTENIEDYTTKVHALKSSARIIGAAALSEKARLLEEAGKANDLDTIKEGNSEMIELYRSYREILSKI